MLHVPVVADITAVLLEAGRVVHAMVSCQLRRRNIADVQHVNLVSAEFVPRILHKFELPLNSIHCVLVITGEPMRSQYFT